MDNNKLLIYQTTKAKPSNIWLLFLFFGWSYGSLDKMGTQILYYLTVGGFGVWALIRLFTLNGAIKNYNRKIAAQADFSNQEMNALGLL